MGFVSDWHNLTPGAKYNLHSEGDTEPTHRAVEFSGTLPRNDGRSATFFVDGWQEFWKHSWEVSPA